MKYNSLDHSIYSTANFLDVLISTVRSDFLSPLDLDTLFAHMPVDQIRKIIFKIAYIHPTFKAPTIPKSIMRQLH